MQMVWQFIKNLLVSLGILFLALVILNLLIPDLLQLIYRDYGTLVAVFALAILVITSIPRRKP